jgi:hypothetical protein
LVMSMWAAVTICLRWSTQASWTAFWLPDVNRAHSNNL